MNHTELVARFFESNEEFAQHVNKGTVEFAEWARSPDGDKAVLDGAKSMAMTIVDLWTSADLRDAATAAFARRPTGVEVL